MSHNSHKCTITKPIIGWLACTLGIIFLSIEGRTLQNWLFLFLKRQYLLPLLGIIALFFITYFSINRLRFGIHPFTILTTMFFFSLCAIAVVSHRLLPIELLHIFVFGALGWFSVKSFGLVHGLLATLTIACGDEILQHFLSDRVGDLHDVALNCLSGSLGLWLGKNRVSSYRKTS